MILVQVSTNILWCIIHYILLFIRLPPALHFHVIDNGFIVGTRVWSLIRGK